MTSHLHTLDKSILALLELREQLLEEKNGQVTHSKGVCTLLTHTIGFGNLTNPAPYEEITKNIWLGFDAEKLSVQLNQHPKADYKLSPPDHHYVIDIAGHKNTDDAWLSIERRLPNLEKNNAYDLHCFVKAKSSDPATLQFSAFYGEGAGTIEHQLGYMSFQTPGRYEYKHLRFHFDTKPQNENQETNVPLHCSSDTVGMENPRLVMFVQPPNARIHFCMYTLLFNVV